MPIAALTNIILVPPELIKGSVMPFSGNKPIIAPMFIIVCVLSQARIPVTRNLLYASVECSIIFFNLLKNATKSAISTVVPTKPNFSANIAKIESLAASGK